MISAVGIKRILLPILIGNGRHYPRIAKTLIQAAIKAKDEF